MANAKDKISAIRKNRVRTPLDPPDPMTNKILDSMHGKSTKQATIPAVLTKASQEASMQLAPIQQRAKTITKITSDEEYKLADAVRGDVDKYLKWWEPQAEGVIRPIRQGLDAMYALNRNMTQPALDLKAGMTRLMSAYQRELIAEKTKAKQEELRLAEEAERKAAQATTTTLKQRFYQAAQESREVAATIDQVGPVEGDSSHSRPVKKWRITNLLEFLTGITSRIIPVDFVEINTVKLNELLRTDEETLRQYPGVEVYEDVQIVSGKKKFDRGEE